ncbi:hypothetical protein JHK87_052478 [Glycine soja]|nr:hypothetical protein JHK87_052478 [Glycine soja]
MARMEREARFERSAMKGIAELRRELGSIVAAMVAAGNKLFNKLGVEELVLASLKSERCRVSHKQCGVIDDGGLCANWKLLLVGANVIEVSYGEGVRYNMRPRRRLKNWSIVLSATASLSASGPLSPTSLA